MEVSSDLPNSWELQPPSRLHWGWVMFLTFFTGGLFGAVWMLVIARWLRNVRGRSTAYPWAWANVVLTAASLAGGLSHHISNEAGGFAFVLFFVVAFLVMGELEERPIALRLSGVMTFICGPVYFQYHLQDFGSTSLVPGEVLGIDRASDKR